MKSKDQIKIFMSYHPNDAFRIDKIAGSEPFRPGDEVTCKDADELAACPCYEVTTVKHQS